MTNKKSAAKWNVGTTDRLFWSARHPEDGERREVLVHFVTIEDEATGARWISSRSFDSQRAAERCVPAASRRLLAGASPVGSAHWDPTWPVYGSQAFQAGQADEIDAERKADEDGSYYDGGVRG